MQKGHTKMQNSNHFSFPRHFAVLALASAIAAPVWAQQAQTSDANSQQAQPATTDSQSAPTSASQPSQNSIDQPLSQPKEGFWGRINPFASKKWVRRTTDPINDRLSELDSVNARNAQDIKDVDARAQAGIQKAQASADAANQTADSANNEAQTASNTAQQANGHVDHLNSTVNGLDQYHQVTDVEIRFRSGSPALTADARAKLDQLATTLGTQNGYIVEMEAHSPAAGGNGIQYSQRMAEAIERYLVTQHQIPVYRMHYVALGNAPMVPATAGTGDAATTGTGNATSTTATSDQDQKPVRVRTSTVHVMLMENSLAAQAEASPQNAPAAAGTEQP
jgi:outer membrane protein OmpA-like peptidoglycan-associated protein